MRKNSLMTMPREWWLCTKDTTKRSQNATKMQEWMEERQENINKARRFITKTQNKIKEI
ncbi:hypothetical protein [Helicobacter acinonychis]|uniref:hypothetical protein n=1 Tax=Helicobacter acinonychis TaxID=212 RepID=UPI001E2BC497|nr:hypothetical protein [Helicobacter acinonychis]